MPAGKWAFICEERGVLRPSHGHTATYQRLVATLKAHCLHKFCLQCQSRSRCDLSSSPSDLEKIQELVNYNERRCDPLSYVEHYMRATDDQAQLARAVGGQE